MELRWFRVHNGFGDYDRWELQFWSPKIESWVPIPRIECESDEEMDFIVKPPEEEDYLL